VTVLTAVAGDVGDLRQLRLDGIGDLTAATAVEAHVWRTNDETSFATLTATVTDAPNRIVTVNLGGAGGWLPLARVGTYLFEVQVSFGSTVKTWPQGRADTIEVRGSK
jgi:hypothetical protein